MARLPDIPGKGLITATGRHAKKAAVGGGLAVIAIGGFVLRRVLRPSGSRDGGEEGAASTDPIAETPTAPPGSEGKEMPKPKPAKPKSHGRDRLPKPVAEAKPKPAAETPLETPKPPRPDPPRPTPPEPEEPAPEPRAKAPETTGTEAPPKPSAEPGNIAGAEDPHHALNNPVEDPDPTEWPDPYDRRSDPLDPPDPDGTPFGEEPHPPTGAESTSEPHRGEDPEAGDREQRVKERDKLDD